MKWLRCTLWVLCWFFVSGFVHFPVIFKRFNPSPKPKISTVGNFLNGERFRHYKMASHSDEPAHPLKLNPDEDFYSVLEVHPSADQNALKKAYYKLVIKYHPDNKGSSAEKDLANRQMMIINTAYRCLKDPLLRKEYDSRRRGIHHRVSYWAREEPRDSIEQTTRAPPHTGANSEISFWEFKEFLEEIYEKSFPESSDFVKELYTRLQNDPEFRANIIRNGDFRRAHQPEQRLKSSPRKTTYRDRECDPNGGRGGGSTSSLQLHLNSLKEQYASKHSMLLADNRDWGDVKDINLIRARLEAVDELRLIGREIESVMDEIRGLQA